MRLIREPAVTTVAGLDIGPRYLSMIEDRFWSRVQRTPDECWTWRGSTDRDGYGWFTINDKTVKAHRVAYWLAEQTDPGRLCVCHTCDNPSCCRPSHLFLGTSAENSADRHRKGREVRGERHHAAKLTDDSVREIRRLYDEGVSQTELARRFGIRQTNISTLVRGKRWTHVN